MDRLNSEGIIRADLIWVLMRKDLVAAARKTDSCLLCRAHRTNEAGLCESCYATLDDPELDLAERWMSGASP